MATTPLGMASEQPRAPHGRSLALEPCAMVLQQARFKVVRHRSKRGGEESLRDVSGVLCLPGPHELCSKHQTKGTVS